MALNISAWSIRQPLPSIVFSIILLVLGWMSFTKLAVTRLPNADIPVISVAVGQFGAAPAELESQVTKIIGTASPASRTPATSPPRSPMACRSRRSSSAWKPTPTEH
jgi:Cu/Ag efflux pump CusA